MARLDPDARELTASLAITGAPRAGKSAVLRAVHQRMAPDRRGAPTAPGEGTAAPMLLDWLALDLGRIGGWTVRVNCYAVPVHRHADSTRRLLLRNADAVLMVLDSQAERGPDNLAAMQDVEAMLDGEERPVPRIHFYSKRDLPPELLLTVEALDAALGIEPSTRFAGDALRGVGVLDAVQAAIGAMLRGVIPGTDAR